MIKIDFEMTSEDGVWIYRDALHLPDDNAYTEAEIESMKQARFERWLAVVTAPPAIDETVIDEIPVEPDPVIEEAPVDVSTADLVVEDIPAQE